MAALASILVALKQRPLVKWTIIVWVAAALIGGVVQVAFAGRSMGWTSGVEREPLSVVSDPRCACLKEFEDPFEDPSAYATGPYAGRCIDTCRFRSVKILAREESGFWRFANVAHMGRFYEARARIDDVQTVDAGFEEFTPGVYHFFLRFNWPVESRGVDLVAQSPVALWQKSSDTSQSLILSVEGVPPVGERYNFWDALLDRYRIVHRVTTGAELLRWTSRAKHPVRFTRLNLEPGQVAKVLRRAIEASQQVEFKQTYDLFVNNCATNALSHIGFVLGDQLNSKRNMWVRVLEALPVRGPISVDTALDKLNLVGEANFEFWSPRATPESTLK